MSNSLINCILDSQNSLYQNITRLTSRKDLVDQIDEKMLEITMTSFFFKGELDANTLTQFLSLLEILSCEKAHIFDRQRLTFLYLVFQRNEYLLSRRTNNLEMFVNIYLNLEGNFLLLAFDNLNFIMSVIKDSLSTCNNFSGNSAQLNSSILSLVKRIYGVDNKMVNDEIVFKILKNLIQQSHLCKNLKLDCDGLGFWTHKYAEDAQIKNQLIDMIVSSPQFLLIFKIRNVSILYFLCLIIGHRILFWMKQQSY